MSEIHLLFNAYGEVMGAFTDKHFLDDYVELCGCPNCVSIESVIVDDPGTIQSLTHRIKDARAEIQQLDKLME